MIVTASEQLIIFSRYIGSQVVITSLLSGQAYTGTLEGIRKSSVLVRTEELSRWIPLRDDLKVCEIRLLLKPLRRLTPAIIETANQLPVQAFITPYYQQLGYDMPVFISPGHPANCKYVQELGLADYRSPEEVGTAAFRSAYAEMQASAT